MTPILYESNETMFASNGLCRLPDMIACTVTEERNGIYEIDFEYPVDGLHFDLIQPGRIIACTHDEKGDVQPFDIVSATKPINGVVTFHGVHISYRLGGMVVSGKNINTLSDAFDLLMNNAVPANPFSMSSDMTKTAYLASADGEPRSVRSMLGGVEGSILDTYGGEYEFDKFNVILHSARGTAKDFVIRYGLNLSDYNDEIDYGETYTAIVPFWRGDNGKGSEVIVKGDLTDSGQPSYNGRTIAAAVDLTDKFEKKPSKSDLQTFAANMLSSNQPYLPARSITVSFVDIYASGEYGDLKSLTRCNLCDTITVVFPAYNMSGRFKIVKTVYDVLLERYNEMELGTLSTSLADALGVSSGGLGSQYSMEVQALSPTYTRTDGTPASGVTITAKRWGQVVQVELVFSRYATSAGGDMASGTISGLPEPVTTPVRGVGYNGSAVLVANLKASGAFSIRSSATITTSSTSYCYFSLTYITED